VSSNRVPKETVITEQLPHGTAWPEVACNSCYP